MNKKGKDDDFLLASNEERRRWMKGKQLWVEVVQTWNYPNKAGELIPLISQARKATPADIEKSRKLHKKGKCPPCGKGAVFYDTAGWMYDNRWCGICGEHLSCI
jgi:hypothetical protein